MDDQNKNTIQPPATTGPSSFSSAVAELPETPLGEDLFGGEAPKTQPIVTQSPITSVNSPVLEKKPRQIPKLSGKVWLSVAVLIAVFGGAGIFVLRHQNTTTPTVNSQSGSTASQSSIGKLKEQSVTFNIDTKVADGKTLTATGPVIVQNNVNSVNAFKVQDASGSTLLVADTANQKIGIGKTPLASGATLQVAGDISANGNITASGAVSADGGATSLSNNGLTINNVLICTSGGCKNLAAQAASGQVFTGDAKTLNGQDGAYYRNASNINAGTLSDKYLPGSVALLSNNQTFGGINAFTAAGNIFVGDGSGLSSLKAGNITSGTLSDSRLSTNVALRGGTNTFSGINNFTSASNSFSGDGSGLTNVDAATLNGQPGSYYTDATNIISGTLSDSRLSNNVTQMGNSFNGVNQLVQLDSSGLLPVLDGSALTNLNASAVNIGTISDSVLSSNVALLNANNVFTGNDDFTSILKVKNTSTSAFQVQKADGSGNILVADTTNTRVAIAQASAAYTLDVAGDINTTTGYRVGGTAGSNLSCSSGDLVQNATISGGIITGGACTAPSIVSTPTLQQVYDASVTSPQITLDANGGLIIQDASTPTAGNLFAVQSNGGGSNYIAVTTAGVAVQGNVDVTGQYRVNGTQISTSNLSDGSTITKAGNSFNGISQLVMTDGAGKLPALDGSAVTNVNAAQLNGQAASFYTNASNISSGTLSDTRLSSNVALLNASQTYSGSNTYSGNNSFTGANTFALSTSGLLVQDAASPLGTDLFSVKSNAGTVNYFSVSASGAKIGTDDICTTAGNCAGSGGGVTTTGGTAGKLAKFSGSQAVVDSIISDNGSTATIAGTLAVNTITPTATLTVGVASQGLILQGDSTTALKATSGGITNQLVFTAPTLSNKTITLPDASGTVAVSASGPLALDAAGNLTCPTCLTSGGGGGTAGVSSINSQTGAITLAGTANQVIITASGGPTFTFSAPQDIATTSTPTFANINVGSGGQFRINGTQISSAALSNDSNLTKNNSSNTLTGANSVAPTTDITGLAVKQTSAASPTSDIFDVTNSSGATKYLAVNSSGNISTAGTLNAAVLQQAGSAVLTTATSFSGDVSGAYNALTIGAGKVTSSNILDGTVSNVDISGTAGIAYSKLNLAGSIVNADISTSAGIAYTKLALNNSIVNADISTTAAIAYSKLSLNNSIVNTDIATTAAIAYSKLALSNSIVNADISTSAAITDSKLAQITSAGKVADSALSNNVAFIASNNSFSGNNIFTGTVLGKNTATTAFQLQKADGTGTVLVADTTNTRIAIAQATAAYTLDVNGDVNVTSGHLFRIAGASICSATGCTAAAGSGNYIQNGTSPQTADYNITGNGTIGGALGVTGTATAGQFASASNGKAAINLTDTTGTPGITLGGDTTLYRTAASALKTDGSLQAGSSIQVGGGSYLSFGASTAIRLQDGGSNVLNIYTGNTLQASVDANGNFTLSGNGLLVMGVKTSDPACTNGAIYYNSSTSTFRGCANGVWNDFAMGASIPVGTISPYSGSTAPAGYLIADGSAVSRTTYSTLFSLIGTTYGAGDGSTTFNLPDLRGRVAVGLGTNADDNALGANDGSALANRTPKHNSTFNLPSISRTADVTLNDPGHSHSIYNFFGGGVTQSGALCGCNNGGGTTSTNSSFTGITVSQQPNFALSGGSVGPGGSRPVDTPAYVTVNYIIKY